MNEKTLGFIGLGRMGLNMATRLVEGGYEVMGYDTNETAINLAKEASITIADDYTSLVASLPSPRVIWIMVPSKFVDTVLSDLTPLLTPGDTLVDGGNSFYQDSLKRHQTLQESGINYLDCGTSGGVMGALHGASLMVGGDETVFKNCEGIFSVLAAPDAYARVGNAGAGHFVKMIHNGIEYGMMGAIAEGMSVLKNHEAEFGIQLHEVLKPYEHESVISSKLFSWLTAAYKSGQIETITGEVPPGETESEMEHITTIGVVKVLEAALAQRKATRQNPSYLGKLVAAMRNQFGGHSVIEK